MEKTVSGKLQTAALATVAALAFGAGIFVQEHPIQKVLSGTGCALMLTFAGRRTYFAAEQAGIRLRSPFYVIR